MDWVVRKKESVFRLRLFRWIGDESSLSDAGVGLVTHICVADVGRRCSGMSNDIQMCGDRSNGIATRRRAATSILFSSSV